MAPIERATEVTLPEYEIEQISELVAQRVQDKLLARFGRWIVINLLAIGGIAGAGLIAFFNLKSDVDRNTTANAYQNERLVEQAAGAASFRAEMNAKLDRISEQVTNLNVTLASHNGRVAGSLHDKGAK